MPSLWDSSTEADLRSLSLWDGSVEQPIGSLTLWDGSAEQPIKGLTPVFVAATIKLATADNPTITVPTGVRATDTLLLGVSSANPLATVALTGATALTGPTDTGTMQGEVLTGTGWNAGDTLSLATATINPSAITACWYRGVASIGGLATATKSGTVTTLVAPDVTDDVALDLIVTMFLEKSGSNVALGAPAVSGVNSRAWQPWGSNATGLPSAWAGDYVGPAAAKTITYPQSSANGLAVQARLRAA